MTAMQSDTVALHLTKDECALIRNALGSWADRSRFKDGNIEFIRRLEDLSDKIYDVACAR